MSLIFFLMKNYLFEDLATALLIYVMIRLLFHNTVQVVEPFI